MKQLIIIVTLCVASIPALSTRAFGQAEVSGELNLTSDAGSGETEPVTEAGADTNAVSYERGGLANTGITLGLKLGAGFSQPFGDLGTGFLAELEVGYVLPVAKREFAVFVAGGYTQPGAEGKDLVDPRLPEPVSYELTQQQLLVTLGLTYRLHLDSKLFRPYASVGPRLFLMRTDVKGSAGGQSFGDNDETDTSIGVFGALGTELHLGPGAALIELSITWARIDGTVLRDTSVASLGVGIGYRIFL